jgi:DNA-damage-inducible protein D
MQLKLMTENKALVVFQSKKIRRAWFRKEWYYSLVDIIGALTMSSNPTDYLKKLRKRDELLGDYLGTNCPHVEMLTSTGKKRIVLAGNRKDIFRLIQSIFSKNAEPFKLWLARLGDERIQEIENPELGQNRIRKYYEMKGYPDSWIKKRLRGIAIREDLTSEWKERGINDQKDFAILTAEISKATFGMTPREYKKHKKLPEKSNANLRDHMDDLELIFTMLGERVTTEISQEKKPKTFHKNKDIAKRGGKVAGDARKNTEKELGRPIVNKKNYLPKSRKKKLIKED